MKYGNYDGKLIPKIPNIVHAVFQSYEPHGEKYLYISEWLSKKMRVQNLKNLVKLSPRGLDSLMPKRFGYLPYVVSLPLPLRGLRREWGFPEDAIIGGRHGAIDTFDVPIVHNTIRELLEETPRLYFVFANTNKFIEHPRVIFLPAMLTRLETSEYLSSLDFFIHARHRGETFGLSLLEAMLNRVPVLSFSRGVDGNHRYILRNSYNSLFDSSECLKSLIRQLPNYEDTQKNYEIALNFSLGYVMKKWDWLLSELIESK